MTATIASVASKLREHARLAVAVSGGVDSLTLATIAGRHHPAVEMFHAVSPAVPAEATARVQAIAAQESWALRVIDAGEFARQAYVANPVNRCYFCKQSLYSAITAIGAALATTAPAQIVSGTNVDDLGEYRPGLDAARELGVRHPFAELGVTKRALREFASSLGLGAISALPSSPCLSSRIETGIPISAPMLAQVHRAERAVRALVPPSASVRCRVRRTGVVLEIDTTTLDALAEHERDLMRAAVTAAFGEYAADRTITLEPYRVGSAFLVNAASSAPEAAHA